LVKHRGSLESGPAAAKCDLPSVPGTGDECHDDAGGHMKRRQFLCYAAAATAVPSFAGAAFALDYPVRPVRVIVPFAAGGITDVVARLVAGKLSEQLGKQFYVENVVGGSGNVGMGQAAKAMPDGYTVLTAFSSYVINPAMFDRVPYDPVHDFDPVALAVTSTTVLVVPTASPAANVKELIARIRANPGTYTYASAGTGTTRILRASSCVSRSASTSCTCRSAAARPRWPRSWAATRRSGSRRRRSR
jgi:tripartite-type tricarboxylate transporter receptor subunit TctC